MKSPATMAAAEPLKKTQLTIPRMKCKHCFYHYARLHPCLFCDHCLKKCTEVIDQSGRNIIGRHPGLGQSLQGWNLEDTADTKVKDTAPYKFCLGRGKLILDTAAKVDLGKNRRQRWRILEKKAVEVERRATRCGFCLPTEKREDLVRYCHHCQKHMCVGCEVVHSRNRLCKHHATVDLRAANNLALM